MKSRRTGSSIEDNNQVCVYQIKFLRNSHARARGAVIIEKKYKLFYRNKNVIVICSWFNCFEIACGDSNIEQ